MHDAFGGIGAVNPKAEIRRPKEIRNLKAEETVIGGHVVEAG